MSRGFLKGMYWMTTLNYSEATSDLQVFKCVSTAPTTMASSSFHIACSLSQTVEPERKKLSEIVPLRFGNRHERRKRAAELRRKRR